MSRGLGRLERFILEKIEEDRKGTTRSFGFPAFERSWQLTHAYYWPDEERHKWGSTWEANNAQRKAMVRAMHSLGAQVPAIRPHGRQGTQGPDLVRAGRP
jgi:hypothetical protein